MEAILVARQSVTNNLEVAVVVGCAFTTVNHMVAVEILVLDIARAKNKVVGLYASLVGYAIFINPLAVSVLTVEIVFGKVAVGLKAPDVAPCLTLVSIHTCVACGNDATSMADKLRVVVPLGNLRL